MLAARFDALDRPPAQRRIVIDAGQSGKNRFEAGDSCAPPALHAALARRGRWCRLQA
jgi:hypothetical protein